MRIHGFYGIHYGGCFQCSAGADLGVNCGLICPQSNKPPSRAWNCDQHHHHYGGPCAAGPPSSLIQLLSRPRERERKKQQQTQATRNLLKVCSRLFNFFLSEVLPSEIVEAMLVLPVCLAAHLLPTQSFDYASWAGRIYTASLSN